MIPPVPAAEPGQRAREDVLRLALVSVRMDSASIRGRRPSFRPRRPGNASRGIRRSGVFPEIRRWLAGSDEERSFPSPIPDRWAAHRHRERRGAFADGCSIVDALPEDSLGNVSMTGSAKEPFLCVEDAAWSARAGRLRRLRR